MSIRSLSLFFLCGLTPFAANAQSAADPSALVEQLRAAASGEGDFEALYDQAEEAGVSRSDLVASRIIYYMQEGDLRGLLSMVGPLQEVRDEMDYGMGGSFASTDELDGLVEALQAVQAYQSNDMAGMEAHTKEAFWLWPQWVQAFGLDQIVQQLRTEAIHQAAMEDTTIDMSYEVRDLDGESVTLASLAEGKKAVLLDFWASWCGPCMRLMPELKERQKVLSEQGVFVAGMNTDDEQPLQKAAQVQEQMGMDMPWLVEAEGQQLSREMLYIDSIPRMILLSPEGKVLYNGHPMDEGLQTALAKLGVSLD